MKTRVFIVRLYSSLVGGIRGYLIYVFDLNILPTQLVRNASSPVINVDVKNVFGCWFTLLVGGNQLVDNFLKKLQNNVSYKM